MKFKIPIYLDYDNCLVNSTIVHLKWCNEQLGLLHHSTRNLPDQMLLNYYGPEAADFWYSGKSYADITPFPGALDFLKTLNKTFNVKVVTANLPSHIHAEKEDHAKYYFNLKPEQLIHVTAPELKAQYTKRGVLVDDDIGHISKHIRLNKMSGVVFNFNRNYGWAKKLPSNLSFYETNYHGLYHTLCKLGLHHEVKRLR